MRTFQTIIACVAATLGLSACGTQGYSFVDADRWFTNSMSQSSRGLTVLDAEMAMRSSESARLSNQLTLTNAALSVDRATAETNRHLSVGSAVQAVSQNEALQSANRRWSIGEASRKVSAAQGR